MNRCKANVHGGYQSSSGCSRPATRDGYCTQHHPDIVASRRAARNALWDEKWAAKEAARERADKRRATCERLADLATELCISFDNAAEDIGGSRPALAIIQDMGPLTAEWEKLK